MQVETLVMISNGEKVLLGFKNPELKFGGKWNGWGGKVEDGEEILDCLIREIKEESGINVVDPQEIGRIKFVFFEEEEPDHYVHIYRAEKYEGDLNPSNDFLEYKWFNVNSLPEEMMPADKHWLPFLVNGKYFQGEIHFDENMQNQKVNVYEVEHLS